MIHKTQRRLAHVVPSRDSYDPRAESARTSGQHRRCAIQKPRAQPWVKRAAKPEAPTGRNKTGRTKRASAPTGRGKMRGKCHHPMRRWRDRQTAAPFVAPRWGERRHARGRGPRASPWADEYDPVGVGKLRTRRMNIANRARTNPSAGYEASRRVAPKVRNSIAQGAALGKARG